MTEEMITSNPQLCYNLMNSFNINVPYCECKWRTLQVLETSFLATSSSEICWIGPNRPTANPDSIRFRLFRLFRASYFEQNFERCEKCLAPDLPESGLRIAERIPSDLTALLMLLMTLLLLRSRRCWFRSLPESKKWLVALEFPCHYWHSKWMEKLGFVVQYTIHVRTIKGDLKVLKFGFAKENFFNYWN